MQSDVSEKPKKRFFSTLDFVLIAGFAGAGIAVKPFIVSLVHIVSTPLMIPGGSLAGGLYMLWPIMARIATGRTGAATLVGLLQGIVVTLTGIPGSQGLASIATYILPCIAIDIIFLFGPNILTAFFSGIASNLIGVAAVNLLFFKLPIYFLLLVFFISALSGGVGGLIAWGIGKKIKDFL
jgi:hypothetical protein